MTSCILWLHKNLPIYKFADNPQICVYLADFRQSPFHQLRPTAKFRGNLGKAVSVDCWLAMTLAAERDFSSVRHINCTPFFPRSLKITISSMGSRIEKLTRNWFDGKKMRY